MVQDKTKVPHTTTIKNTGIISFTISTSIIVESTSSPINNVAIDIPSNNIGPIIVFITYIGDAKYLLISLFNKAFN